MHTNFLFCRLNFLARARQQGWQIRECTYMHKPAGKSLLGPLHILMWMLLQSYVLVIQVQHVAQCCVSMLPTWLIFALGYLVCLLYLYFYSISVHSHTKFGSLCSTAEIMMAIFRYFRYFKCWLSVTTRYPSLASLDVVCLQLLSKYTMLTCIFCSRNSKPSIEYPFTHFFFSAKFIQVAICEKMSPSRITGYHNIAGNFHWVLFSLRRAPKRKLNLN